MTYPYLSELLHDHSGHPSPCHPLSHRHRAHGYHGIQVGQEEVGEQAQEDEVSYL